MGCLVRSLHNCNTYRIPGAPNLNNNSFNMGNPPSLISFKNGSFKLERIRFENMAPGDFNIAAVISRFRTLDTVPLTYLNSFMSETKYRSLGGVVVVVAMGSSMHSIPHSSSSIASGSTTLSSSSALS